MDSRCRARKLVKGIFGSLHGEAKSSSSSDRGSQKSSNTVLCSSHVTFMVHHQERAAMTRSNKRVVHEAMKVHEPNFLNPYGVVVDEHIDRKAAMYISSVQERFRLEGLINLRSLPHDTMCSG